MSFAIMEIILIKLITSNLEKGSFNCSVWGFFLIVLTMYCGHTETTMSSNMILYE